jgi:HSP20 family protein
VEEKEEAAANFVRRERYVGQQYRAFTLPQEIDEKGAEAQYDNGVLCLSLPKKSGSVSKMLSVK